MFFVVIAVLLTIAAAAPFLGADTRTAETLRGRPGSP